MVEKVKNAGRKINSPMARGQSESTILTNKNIELNFVRNKLKSFQADLLTDVEKRMAGMIDEIMQEIRLHELQTNEFRNFAKPHHQQNGNSTWNNRSTSIEQSKDNTTNTSKDVCDRGKVTQTSEGHQTKHTKRVLPDKIFVTRESYLTALLEVDHMKTIYHIFYIILLIFLMNSISYDYFVEGRVNFGLGTFKSSFQKIHYVFGVWLLEHVFVFALYYAVKTWSSVRSKLARQKSLRRFWSHSCLITYIASQLVFCYVGSVLCLKLDLPFITSTVLLAETTRLLMKMHAFVRTNADRIIAGKLKTDSDEKCKQSQVSMPAFQRYLYFLFAPTLIYRDNYPRTSIIRWKFASARLLEVIAIAFLYSYIHERHIKVHFFHYGLEELSASSLIVKLFGMLMPSVIIFLCGFYLLLHSWLNFTAELLRFGDRMFYKDWWTSSTYDSYYRNWNVVVHDWLYEYVYKDFYNHIFKGSKLAASLMVFLMSALVHEQLMGFALQMFFPVMFLFFGVIGVALVFLTRSAPKDLGNIFIWFTLIFGNGLMISLYCMEYYAQINCPKPYSNNWVDRLIPAAWSCYKMTRT